MLKWLLTPLARFREMRAALVENEALRQINARLMATVRRSDARADQQEDLANRRHDELKRMVEERIALGDERGDGGHPHRADRPALRAEPPLVGQPLGQEGGELLDQSIHELSSGGLIENQ